MANMKFYMTPGSCSTGIHILLEELGLVFEAYIVNLPAGDQFKPDYVAINPKSTIPTLVTPDGTSITEFSAIAWWLARKYPKANLLPGDLYQETYVLETINYIVSTIHMQGYTRIFTTENYAFNEADSIRIKAQGETIVRKGLAIIDKQLADKEYLIDTFSIADAALFYVEFWADRIDIKLPVNCRRHYKNMLNRPAVQQVLREEGYSTALASSA
jgi:glutathione S-transferase